MKTTKTQYRGILISTGYEGDLETSTKWYNSEKELLENHNPVTIITRETESDELLEEIQKVAMAQRISAKEAKEIILQRLHNEKLSKDNTFDKLVEVTAKSEMYAEMRAKSIEFVMIDDKWELEVIGNIYDQKQDEEVSNE